MTFNKLKGLVGKLTFFFRNFKKSGKTEAKTN